MTPTSISGKEVMLSEAGILSREVAAAVGSAFNTLTERLKKHEASLEDLVRETLRPEAKMVAGRKLVSCGRANGRGRNRTATRQR
jgi:hypothetical protein